MLSFKNRIRNGCIGYAQQATDYFADTFGNLWTWLERQKKIEHKYRETYSYAMNLGKLRLGTPQEFLVSKGSNEPAFIIKPYKLTFNVPCPNFLLLNSILIDEVEQLGSNVTDAYVFRGMADVDIRSIGPTTRITIDGKYTGYFPCEYRANYEFPLQMILIGTNVSQEMHRSFYSHD